MSAGYRSEHATRNGVNNGGRRPTMVFMRSKQRQSNTQLHEVEIDLAARGSPVERFDFPDDLRPGNKYSVQPSRADSWRRESDYDARHENGEKSGGSKKLANVHRYSATVRSAAGRRFYKNVVPSSPRDHNNKVSDDGIMAGEPILSSCNSGIDGSTELLKAVTDSKPECSAESRPNVWTERAQLYHDAVPKNSEEEERMLQEALVISSKRYEEENEFRNIVNMLEKSQIGTESPLPSETSVTNLVKSDEVPINHFLDPFIFPESGASGGDGSSISFDISAAQVNVPASTNVRLCQNVTTIEESFPAVSPVSPDVESGMSSALQVKYGVFHSSNLVVNEQLTARFLTCDEAEEYLHGNTGTASGHLQHLSVAPSPPHDSVDGQRCFDLSSFSSEDSGFLSDISKAVTTNGMTPAIEPPPQDIRDVAGFAWSCRKQLENVPLVNTDCGIIGEERSFTCEGIVNEILKEDIDSNHQFEETEAAEPFNVPVVNDSSEGDTVVGEESVQGVFCASCKCSRVSEHPEEPSCERMERNEDPVRRAPSASMLQYPNMSFYGGGRPAFHPYPYGYPGSPMMSPVPFVMAPGMGFVPPGPMMMPGIMPYSGIMPDYGRFPMMQPAGMMMQPMMMMMPAQHLPQMPMLSSSNDNGTVYDLRNN